MENTAFSHINNEHQKLNQRTEGPESCQDKFLADALLNEAYMSK